MSSRAASAVSSIPPATLSIIMVCCLVFLFQIVMDPPLHHYTLCPRLVIHLSEYYRFVTSAIFHGGALHLIFNMTSLAAIGSLLEKRSGTFMHAVTVLWGILLTSATYTICAVLLHVTFGSEALMYQHSVGFSGVIFQLSVLEANLSPSTARSVFGFFRVPAHLYPWALLLALQFILPQVSFLGHLAGILVGTLQLYNLLDVIMPSNQYLNEMEGWSIFRPVTSLENFVATPEDPDAGTHNRNPGEFCNMLLRSVRLFWKFLRDVLATLKVIICGHGLSNENIQLSSVGRNFSNSDDDWVGLPPPPSPNDVESSTV